MRARLLDTYAKEEIQSCPRSFSKETFRELKSAPQTSYAQFRNVLMPKFKTLAPGCREPTVM